MFIMVDHTRSQNIQQGPITEEFKRIWYNTVLMLTKNFVLLLSPVFSVEKFLDPKCVNIILFMC